jgi:hypothetical protein
MKTAKRFELKELIDQFVEINTESFFLYFYSGVKLR